MRDPIKRLALVVQALARPVAVAIATGCEEPLTYAQLGRKVNRGTASVQLTLRELLAVGAVVKPAWSYTSSALEAGEMRCAIPALLRELASEIEALP